MPEKAADLVCIRVFTIPSEGKHTEDELIKYVNQCFVSVFPDVARDT